MLNEVAYFFYLLVMLKSDKVKKPKL